MLRFIYKKLSLEALNSKASSFSHGFCLSKSFLRPMSEMSTFTDPKNFTVSYLQNSCGFSLNSAISVSKKLLIENSEKTDSVLKLMRTHGLTQTHIENIIATCPALLLADLEDKLRPNMELLESLGFSGASLGKLMSKDPRVLDGDLVNSVEFFRAHGFSDKQIAVLTMKRPRLFLMNANKIFKPKLDFFKSMGFADGDVAEILSSEPYILERSLENHIIPCFQVLKRVLGTDEKVVKVIKAGSWVLEYNGEKNLEQNILILRSHAVPEPMIFKMLTFYPRTLNLMPQQIKEILHEVVKLGFDPNTVLFALAFRSMSVTKKLWQRKVEAYKSFGMSEDEVYSAFKIQPMFMLISEKKIKKMMNFFINKLNIEPSVICRFPKLLMLSLEKRIIPRCSVLQLLMSRGFIKEDARICHYLTINEEKFVKKLVKKYQQVLPEIVKAHQGKIEFLGFSAIL